MNVPDELATTYINWALNLVSGKRVVLKEPHGDEGVVYRLQGENDTCFLKIRVGSTLQKEAEKLEWLESRLSVPHLISHVKDENSGALLMTGLEGKNLKIMSQEWSPEKTIDMLVTALLGLHATDISGWPFGEAEKGMVLVHGDACLPNFIFSGDVFSGYIDLGNAQVASPDVDLAAAIWSLQYNLGAGYGTTLLEKYGYADTSEETVEGLRLRYETYQKEAGFSLA